MITWFVSRHAGAIEWIRSKNIPVDSIVTHLDIEQINAGDVVIGTLPVHLIAAVNERGANYYQLSIQTPANKRGVELTAEELEILGAKIEGFSVSRKSAVL